MSKKYYYSLLIPFLFGLISTYYQPANGSLAKFLFNLYIYFSFIFIPFGIIKLYKNYFTNKSKLIFLLLISYGLITILRDLFNGEIASLFGNPYYGPAFLVPFFILWGAKADSIHWLHRLSILAIKAGIILMPFVLIWKITLPVIAFIPTFFLILNYKYAPPKDRIWILLGLVIGSFGFWEGDYRSGIIRILISLGIFMLVQLHLKKTYKYALLAMLAIPVYGIFSSLTTGESLFSEISNFGRESERNVLQDTRTLLYAETMNDLIKTKTIIFGKGPLGTYYSDYFAHWSFDGGDSEVRHGVEVGVLQYLLKGGIVYLLLVVIIIIQAILNGIKNAKNQYIISLTLILAGFFLYSFVENIPSYSFSFIPFWIIIGICLSQRFKEYDDNQIKILLQNKNAQISL